MKKKIITIILCSFLVIGCGKKNNIKEISLEEVNIKVEEYFVDENNDRNNLVYNYIDLDNNTIIVGLIDNSKEKQDEFLNAIFDKETIKYIKDKSFIKFLKEDPVTTSDVNFKIKRNNTHDKNKYYEYYKNNDRTIYFASDIEEFYITNENDMTLKNYIKSTYQTFDDSIKSITNKLNKIAIIKDGGTTIYKSKELNLTMITCNTIEGNKDIYIDNYNTDINETMCK